MDLQKIVPADINTVRLKLKLKNFYSHQRKQYHSTQILAELLENQPADTDKIVGLTDVDIYIPILTFLFGEAQLCGKGALVSTYRLHNSFYGLPKDDSLFYERTLKEVIHELGHTLGLVHCANFECIMHSSTAIEDTDLKKAMYCLDCKAILQEKCCG